MQVKHPPNQITAKVNATSTSTSMKLFLRGNSSTTAVEAFFIDGERITSFSTSSGYVMYTFPTIGEHEVKIVIKKDKQYSGDKFFYQCQISSVDFSEFRTGFSSVVSLFNYCENLTEVKGLKQLAGNSSLVSLKELFYYCTSLQSIDLSSLDVSNVTDMSYMFYFCTSLQSIDLSSWGVSNVANMSNMFERCVSLQSIDLSSWDVSNVTKMSNMFYYCTSLQSIDLSSWDVSNVTNMSNMFYRCKSLQSVDISNWDMRNATALDSMFYECTALKSVGISYVKLPVSPAASMGSMFYSVSSTLDVSSVIVGGSLKGIFSSYKGTTIIGLENWDVSSVVDMSSMFTNCTKLTSVEGIRNWKPLSLQNTASMFYGCLFSDIPVASWGVSTLTNAKRMFSDCSKLNSIDLSTWNLAGVTDFSDMMNYCRVLKEVRFNTEINESAVFSNFTYYAGGSSTILYYYPHQSFIDKLLPNVSSYWQKIDITTLE
jgi:surface protein